MHRLYAFLFLRVIAARGFNIQKTGDKTGMTQVTLKQDGKTLTALLSGEIDHHWAAILREKIDERAEIGRAHV